MGCHVVSSGETKMISRMFSSLFVNFYFSHIYLLEFGMFCVLNEYGFFSNRDVTRNSFSVIYSCAACSSGTSRRTKQEGKIKRGKENSFIKNKNWIVKDDLRLIDSYLYIYFFSFMGERISVLNV